MFSTYKQAIRQYYLLKKTSGELPIRLQEPSPAKIRDHLEHYLSTSFDPMKDGQVLEAFFGKQQDAAAYAKMVKHAEIDDFRPVINWLKGKTSTPEDKHVHLAALLLDFERPCVFGKNYNSDETKVADDVDVTLVTAIELERGDQPEAGSRIDLPETTTTVEGEKDIKKGDVMLPSGEENSLNGEGITDGVNKVNRSAETPGGIKTPSDKLKKRALLLFLMLIAISIGFVIKDAIADPEEKQCMYWKDDHYVAIACDAKLSEETEKIALDTFLVANFRKITKPDTITERSIGKIWYLKHDKKFDYFTVKGVHPVHGRRLSRLSDRIYKNEIASERLQSAGQ
ncbi:hypothetical protein [Pedobacter sp.]